MNRCLRMTHPPLLLPTDLEKVEEGMLQILERIGIEVTHAPLLTRLASAGYRPAGGRIRIPRAACRAFLEETQASARKPRPAADASGGFLAGAPSAAHSPSALQLTPSAYPLQFLNAETGAIESLTTGRLAEATRFIAALQPHSVIAHPPGYPADVAPVLQPLMKFRIGFENIAGFAGGVDPKTPEPFPFLLEMCEIAGKPLRQMVLFVLSPLRLAGDWLDALLAYDGRMQSVQVVSMPAVGASVPIRPLEGLAVAAAEVVGSVILLRECLQMKITWGVSTFPFDARGLNMSYGSPESILLPMAANEVTAHLRGEAPHYFLGDIHCLAKEPGPQAAAEKMSSFLTGAMLGNRYFFGAGTLSLDEVFSPVQMMLDLELRDHVQRLLGGLDAAMDLDGLEGMLRPNLEQGFLASNETLLEHGRHYWYPRFFERRSLGSWQAAGSPGFLQAAREAALRVAQGYAYEPPEDQARAIRAVYARAQKHFGLQ